MSQNYRQMMIDFQQAIIAKQVFTDKVWNYRWFRQKWGVCRGTASGRCEGCNTPITSGDLVGKFRLNDFRRSMDACFLMKYSKEF